jgi:hypothetical protein
MSFLHSRSWLRSLLLCQVWAFLLFAPALGMITLPANRYFWGWSREVLGVRFAVVTAVGLGLFALGGLLRLLAPGRFATLAGLAATATLGLLLWWGFQQIASEAPHGLMLQVAMLPILLVGLVQISWRRGWTLTSWKTGLEKAALCLAPVLPIFWLTALSYPTNPSPSIPTLAQARQVPDRPGQTPADNVYLFVFDEWPYAYSFSPEGQVLPLMPKLAAAAQTMCVFSDCHSPGCHTYASMSRLICQRTERVVVKDPSLVFWTGSEFLRPAEVDNLFTQARARGYRTYMVGWYLPYPALLGSSVDFVRSTLYYDQLGDAPWQRAKTFCWDAAIQLLGEPTAQRTIGGSDILHNYSVVWQNQTLLEYTQAVLADPRPCGQFAIFHLPLPHYPFCYGPQGVKPLNVGYDRWSPEALQEQLVYLDQVIGQILEQIRAAGKEANSTVILTSDHSWRCDPQLRRYWSDGAGLGRAQTHVPLLIRFPGQTGPVLVDAPFSTVNLQRLLEAVRTGQQRPEELPQWVRQGDMYVPVPDPEAFEPRPQVK